MTDNIETFELSKTDIMKDFESGEIQDDELNNQNSPVEPIQQSKPKRKYKTRVYKNKIQPETQQPIEYDESTVLPLIPEVEYKIAAKPKQPVQSEAEIEEHQQLLMKIQRYLNSNRFGEYLKSCK